MKRGGFQTKGRDRAEPRRNSLSRGTPLKKVNPARQAKRRQQYYKKLNAYRASDTYRVVEARAAGMCEKVAGTRSYSSTVYDVPAGWWANGLTYRCCERRENGARLTHHHITYARFGGKELPEDVIVLCDRHNAEAESQHPTRNRNYKRKSA